MVSLAPDAPAKGDGVKGSPAVPQRVVVALVALTLLLSALVGAAVVEIPYVALKPGAVRPVTEQVLVEGARSYPPEESIAYTTVNTGSTTLFEALVGWLDDDIDVLPRERLLGDRSENENRRYNAQLMDTSKLTAIAVALDFLGEEVAIRTTGTVVRLIVEDTPAAEVLETDDVVVAVDGEAIDEPDELGAVLQRGGPGAEHTLTIERPAGSTNRTDVTIRTVEAPDDPTRAIIGVGSLEERIAGYEFPFDVTIDSGKVGGPSAGLAFTLSVIDVLTAGELTGGHKVAATGTINLDGVVGPVGGGAQKAVSVRDAGYGVFLVPSAELDEVREAVGDDLEVLAVDSLVEALEALDSLGGNAGTLLADAGDAST